MKNLLIVTNPAKSKKFNLTMSKNPKLVKAKILDKVIGPDFFIFKAKKLLSIFEKFLLRLQF